MMHLFFKVLLNTQYLVIIGITLQIEYVDCHHILQLEELKVLTCCLELVLRGACCLLGIVLYV